MKAKRAPKKRTDDECCAKPKYPKVHVDLSGGSANAFSIIGRTMAALKRGGASEEEISEFTAEAKSGDFDNVLQTVMRWVETS